MAKYRVTIDGWNGVDGVPVYLEDRETPGADGEAAGVRSLDPELFREIDVDAAD